MTGPATPPVPQVSVTDLGRPFDPATVLDVREADEWAAGHIAGAVHIPLAELPARLSEVPAGDRVVVACRSGGRSARAAAFLLHRSVRAVNLDGGMMAWAEAGRPMTSSSGDAPTVL